MILTRKAAARGSAKAAPAPAKAASAAHLLLLLVWLLLRLGHFHLHRKISSVTSPTTLTGSRCRNKWVLVNTFSCDYLLLDTL